MDRILIDLSSYHDISVRTTGYKKDRMSQNSTSDIHISFESITKNNVHNVRKLNSSILPIRYHDSFYADVPKGNPDFNLLGECIE